MLVFALLAAAISSVNMVWRGGGLVTLKGETATQGRTQLRRITSSLIMGLLTLNPLVAVIYFLSYIEGIGVPFGALGGWNKEPLIEFGPLDWLAAKTQALYFPGTGQRTWGLLWVTYWALITGGLMSLVTLSIIPMLLYLFQGVLCWLVCKCVRNPTIRACEWATGAIQGLALCL